VKKIIFSKSKKNIKNLAREVLDNDPKYLWMQGFVCMTQIVGLVKF